MTDRQKTNYNLPIEKENIIAILEHKLREISKERNDSPKHSLPYYNGLIKLLNKVIFEIATRQIFPAPDGWYYSFIITNIDASLYIRHKIPSEQESEQADSSLDEVVYDESFRLICYPTNLMTVDDYAKLNGIEPVTVRQWIRRGKLRTAVKIGGEWRIPEITDTPSRGFSSVRYYNNKRLFLLPKSYNCMNQQPFYIDIYPAEKKGYCQIYLDGIPAKLSGEPIPDSEREKIELALISTPGMTNSYSTILSIPDIKESYSRGIQIRTRGMRLPQDWDPNLFGRSL